MKIANAALIGTFLASATISSAQTTSLKATQVSNNRQTARPMVVASPALGFLTSEAGRKMAANFPPLAGYLSAMGVKVPPAELAPSSEFKQAPISSPTQATFPCDSPAGALFNLEPLTGSPELRYPAPQFARAVDHIPAGGVSDSDLVIEVGDDFRGAWDQYRNRLGAGIQQLPNAWGFTMSGYYVHRAGTDCSASFEGALPRIFHPATQDVLYGYSPAIAVDPTRKRVYAVDIRYSATVNGLGLFATTKARLDNPQYCADGTQLTDSNGDDTAARNCWPTRELMNPVRNIFPSTFADAPQIAVDTRPNGPGAGDVYVTWTNFDLFHAFYYIQLIACPQNFGSYLSCSPPLTISPAADQFTDFSHIAIRPDGVFSVIYVSDRFIETDTPPYERQVFDLKHVSCTPNGAPAAPTCSAASLIATESQPIPFGGGPSSVYQAFPMPTFPVHDYRMNGNTAEEFVTWARCKVDPYYWIGALPYQNCVDADVELTWSATDGSGTPLGWVAPVLVDDRKGNQVMPSLKTDPKDGTMQLIYLNASADDYNERYLLTTRRIRPGDYMPDDPGVLATVPVEAQADPFFPYFAGNALGISSRDGETYVSFTGQAYPESVHKILVPSSNNLLLKY